ncbi:MAG: T9SS type A sorting domain-containing protein [Flavisolibacter sp.]
MRRALPLALLLASINLSSNLSAQNDRFAYAITDISKEGAGWNALRKLDLQTGQYSQVLLNGLDVQTVVYDAVSKKQLLQKNDEKYGTALHAPFSTGVAAAAYDKKHNRLYFTPMFVDQLRYVDLKTMKVYYVTGQPFSKMGNMHNDEAKIVTRMVINPDGNGYAITNDANTFIRFSTGKKPVIEQLGSLVDDPSNGNISIHNRCSSFGGDMISDDKGNLYILSARNNIFKVNTGNKVATYLGSIKNLSANFTVNGAVVDAEGNLLVSSAVDANTYYVVNPKDWTASAYHAANGIFKSSDLANSNFLVTKKISKDLFADDNYSEAEIQKMIVPTEKFAKLIAVYPNPVTTSQITVQFSKVPSGNYVVELRDVMGRRVHQQNIAINSETQSQSFTLSQGNAKGIYLIKIFNNINQSVFTQKLVVQ